LHLLLVLARRPPHVGGHPLRPRARPPYEGDPRREGQERQDRRP
jgi:hypothetical protein